METPIVKSQSVLSQARRQSAGMEFHPELAHDLPFSASEISALVAKYLSLKSDVEVLRSRVKAQAEETRAVLFALREACSANIDQARAKLGRYAPELTDLGAKPLPGAHGRRRSAADGADGADAPGVVPTDSTAPPMETRSRARWTSRPTR